MSALISTLTSLRDCGRDGLEISNENSNFVWNGRYRAWEGWMHVYSGNKAGKGAQHEPVINPNGTYPRSDIYQSSRNTELIKINFYGDTWSI